MQVTHKQSVKSSTEFVIELLGKPESQTPFCPHTPALPWRPPNWAPCAWAEAWHVPAVLQETRAGGLDALPPPDGRVDPAQGSPWAPLLPSIPSPHAKGHTRTHTQPFPLDLCTLPPATPVVRITPLTACWLVSCLPLPLVVCKGTPPWIWILDRSVPGSSVWTQVYACPSSSAAPLLY